MTSSPEPWLETDGVGLDAGNQRSRGSVEQLESPQPKFWFGHAYSSSVRLSLANRAIADPASRPRPFQPGPSGRLQHVETADWWPAGEENPPGRPSIWQNRRRVKPRTRGRRRRPCRRVSKISCKGPPFFPICTVKSG